jgi:hypothetical protein
MLKHDWTNEVQEVLRLQQEMDSRLSVPVSTQFIQQVPCQGRSEGFGDFKIGEQVIQSVKYAYGLVPPAKEEKWRQGMTAD